MMKKTTITLSALILFIFFGFLPANAQQWEVKKGEKLSYFVAFHSLLTGNIKGGVATLTVDKDTQKIGNMEVYHALLKGNTSGIVEWFYKVNNHYESYFSVETLYPQLYIEQIKENKYRRNDTVRFDHTKKVAYHDDKSSTMPVGTNDLVSMIYAVRAMDVSHLSEGDSFLLPLFTDRKAIESNVKFIGKEKVKTKFGERLCYGFSPEVAKGKVFREKYPATLWISADADRLPMLVEAKMRVGKIKLELFEQQ